MRAMRFDNDSLPDMFEPDAEAMPAEQLAALQTQRLRVLIDRLLAAGGVQAGRLAEAGVTGGGEVSLEDLAKLPTTDKQDLWDTYPFGLLAVPREQVVAVHGRAGRAGGPRWFRTPKATSRSGPGCAHGRLRQPARVQGR